MDFRNRFHIKTGHLMTVALCMLLFCINTNAQKNAVANNNIRLNQLGFYPSAPKTVVVTENNKGVFEVDDSGGRKVFSGKLVPAAKPDLGGDTTWIADFSSLSKPGKYWLNVPGVGVSYVFSIKSNVLKPVANASIKAYYFMRASMPLEAKYAGKWHRAEGHPDSAVLIHPSAASTTRPAGTKISSPKGWYDAGDYNKYIVNSGISTATLLSLYEDFPAYMNTISLNIPESGDAVPDILNETLWNIRWMLTMQDPADGGVYHKLTNAVFDKMEMPEKGTEPRYVVQKSTAATLDFASVMAQASRIFSKYNTQLPGLADSCLKASEKAWQWAKKNPDVLYNQDAMNKKYSPAVTTGTYGDYRVQDEFIWAACELLVTTGQKQYADAVNIFPDDNMPLPTWGQVRTLGYYTLLKHKTVTDKVLPGVYEKLRGRLIKFADDLMAGYQQSAFKTVMGHSKRDFNWGSNSDAANEGIALIQAYKLTGDNKYLLAALSNLDYILGRNGTGYCYVTDFGAHSPMHPHHRPSVSDGIVDPVPGLLVGGPNPGMQDGIKVPSTVPDRAYIDDDRAYAVNEIAINWNAPFAYLSNAIQALQNKLVIKP